MDSAPGLSGIHQRMPVILKDEAVTSWLDPKITDKNILNDIVLHNFEENFDYYPVSKDVNYTANNSKDCVERLPEKPEPDLFS
jgi:putative SOS response-associated peptidase YedK